MQEIARRAGLTRTTVHEALLRIYKKHGLAKRDGRRALGKKFGLTLPRFGRGLGERRRKRTMATERAIPITPQSPQPAPAPS